MKLQTSKISTDQGNVLIMTLVMTFIIGTTLASYLTMVQGENVSVFRSQTWNSSLAVTEAGVEEAMQLLNKNVGSLDFSTLTNWSTTYSGDGWDSPAANVYHIQRYVGANYYDVYITNSGATPTIVSKGTVTWNYSYASAARPFFAAQGVPTTTQPTVKRAVNVNTKIDALFNGAMAALQQIDFNGNNIATDSFDSGDPNYSNNGLYPYGQPSKTKANGDVVTDSTVINSLNVGNANIKGHVKTGPSGTIAIGPNGSVGDSAWVSGGTSGIETGYSADDMNVLFPDASLPGDFNPLPLNKLSTKLTVNGVSYDYAITTSGDYVVNSSMSGSLYIASNVTTRVEFNVNLNMTGNDQIHIASGASVKFYANTPSFSLGGSGLMNDNGNAGSFYYFGLPVNTSVTFGGNANFIGAIYAPEAAFTLGGGGSNVLDFIGSSVTKSVKMNGKFNFHYDEALARNGMGRGYIPTNWKEVPAT